LPDQAEGCCSGPKPAPFILPVGFDDLPSPSRRRPPGRTPPPLPGSRSTQGGSTNGNHDRVALRRSLVGSTRGWWPRPLHPRLGLEGDVHQRLQTLLGGRRVRLLSGGPEGSVFEPTIRTICPRPEVGLAARDGSWAWLASTSVGRFHVPLLSHAARSSECDPGPMRAGHGGLTAIQPAVSRLTGSCAAAAPPLM
jgi:hypothetical protein